MLFECHALSPLNNNMHSTSMRGARKMLCLLPNYSIEDKVIFVGRWWSSLRLDISSILYCKRSLLSKLACFYAFSNMVIISIVCMSKTSFSRISANSKWTKHKFVIPIIRLIPLRLGKCIQSKRFNAVSNNGISCTVIMYI